MCGISACGTVGFHLPYLVSGQVPGVVFFFILVFGFAGRLCFLAFVG